MTFGSAEVCWMECHELKRNLNCYWRNLAGEYTECVDFLVVHRRSSGELAKVEAFVDGDGAVAALNAVDTGLNENNSETVLR